MHLEEKLSTITHKILPQSNVSVIQMFVFTIEYNILYFIYQQQRNNTIQEAYLIIKLLFDFVIFSTTPPPSNCNQSLNNLI